MKNRLNHIAIIMDGNGRWATNRGLKRVKGHEEGANRVRDITTFASNQGIKFLTLYAFSTENWKRPKMEIDFLMKLMDRWLKNELKTYQKHNVKFETIGDLTKLSPKLQKRIEDTKKATEKNSGLRQVLAVNYGSRDEIIRAVQKIKESNIEVTEENFNTFLDTKGMPEVDILIRTGGDKRVSNFLLWQIAYSELFFTKTLWPDFREDELKKIIEEYHLRERRFGGI